MPVVPEYLFITPQDVRLRLSSPENVFATKDELTWIAGSVVMSENPPLQLKFWRKKFGIKQADLAKKMVITPSVLSDYEKGRRPSPGANFIKRYLQALYELAQVDGISTMPKAPAIQDAVNINQQQ